MSLIPRSYSTEKPSWSSGTIADTNPEKVCENGSDLIRKESVQSNVNDNDNPPNQSIRMKWNGIQRLIRFE